MGLFKTLADLQKVVDQSNSHQGPRRQYLSLKSGDQVRVRFRQELTIDAKNYAEEDGTGYLAAVHVSPYDFKKKLACTTEDEKFDFRCWMHEQVAVDRKWRDVKHLLLNVAVLEDGVWVNKLFDQTFSPKKVAVSLIEYATEYGSITDRDYKFTRTGSGFNDTSYSLIPLSESKMSEEITDLEFYDLDTVYRKLPYDEQEEYFMAEEAAPKAAASNW